MHEEKRRAGTEDDPPPPLPGVEHDQRPAQELDRDGRAEEQPSQDAAPTFQCKVGTGHERQDQDAELPKDKVVTNRGGEQGQCRQHGRRTGPGLSPHSPHDQHGAEADEQVFHRQPACGRARIRQQTERQCEQDRGRRVWGRVRECLSARGLPEIDILEYSHRLIGVAAVADREGGEVILEQILTVDERRAQRPDHDREVGQGGQHQEGRDKSEGRGQCAMGRSRLWVRTWRRVP